MEQTETKVASLQSRKEESYDWDPVELADDASLQTVTMVTVQDELEEDAPTVDQNNL